jgi:hypothetical protein
MLEGDESTFQQQKHDLNKITNLEKEEVINQTYY